MIKNSLSAICRNSLDLMICKKNSAAALLTVLILIFTSFFDASQAVLQKGGLEYDDNRFDYSALDTRKLINEGNQYFDSALKAARKYERNEAFANAMGKYYLVTKADEKNVYAITQIARIHALRNEPRYAKQNFYKAVGIEPDNSYANFYFGEFYFNGKDYNRALPYYIKAYRNNYANSYILNYRLGIIYEKLADLEKSKFYYEKALKLNPGDDNLKSKIQTINNLNYGKSEYYSTGAE